jgi:hypothetical protein
MVWRGILAKPTYAVSSKNVLLVGVNSLGTSSDKGNKLDRLNAEVTVMIALNQTEHRTCDTAYAILLKRNRPARPWHVDVCRIESTLDNHYFAHIRSQTLKTKTVPSVVVSFVLQQRLLMKSIPQSAT